MVGLVQYRTAPYNRTARYGRICEIIKSNLVYTYSLRRTSARDQTSENVTHFAYARVSLIQRVRVALLAR
jgi:hypothetical protein